MKSLQESLFDKDLVKKGIPIDFESLRIMLFEFGRKWAKLFDKAGVNYSEGINYNEGRQAIFIRKSLYDSNRKESVCFELQFGVTNEYKEVFTIFTKRNDARYSEMQNCSAFNVPSLWVYNLRESDTDIDAWKVSFNDINATKRVIDRKVKLENSNRHAGTIEATYENINKVFDLYDGMIKVFCSTGFEKKLKEYISRYESKKEMPGLIMDILMKELINKA